MNSSANALKSRALKHSKTASDRFFGKAIYGSENDTNTSERSLQENATKVFCVTVLTTIVTMKLKVRRRKHKKGKTRR